MMEISDTITGSKCDKNEKKKEKGGTGELPAGSPGASGGKYYDEMDFNKKVYSGLAKRDVIWDKKVAEVVRSILAHMKLNNQQFLEEKPFRVRIASSHEKSTEELSKRVEFERRRFSLPSNTPQQQQLGAIGLPHQRSEPLLSQMNQSRKLNLNDPLATSVLNNLELLEGLGKSLDGEYKYGEIKCWKHLSQYFGVEAKTYEDFTRSQKHSPTEDLFEFLRTRQPEEFTVGKLKDKLSSIERSDIHPVLLEANFDDETQVGSLFDSHPHVIAKMAILLDKEEKPGKRNWKYLADMFGVPRSESEYFGESIQENPTKELFDHLRVKKPRLTIGELKKHLRIFKMQDVLDVLAESKTVKDNSRLTDLWEDLEIAARVCNLLNKKHTKGIRWWRLLGNKLGVKKDTLDVFTNEGEMISPTEVLINHLGVKSPSLIMADLIWALERIGRLTDDDLSVVEAFFPDGHISRFLASAKAYFEYPEQQITPTRTEATV